MNNKSYFKYIGKVKESELEKNRYHLLVYHSLDVAALAKEYLEQRPDFVAFYSIRFGFDSDETFIDFILFFIALHDLGKFSPTFQNILPGIWDNFPKFKPVGKIGKYKFKHDTLGFLYWDKMLKKIFANDLNLNNISSWMGIVTGHHGKPPQQVDNFPVHRFFNDQDKLAVEEWIEYLWSAFLAHHDIDSVVQNPSFEQNSKSFSWWLAGLTVLSDWLGSNSSYFEYTSNIEELSDYWKRCQQSAKSAVLESGLCRSFPAEAIPFNRFFDFSPTPLQAKVSNIELFKGPNLFILEDVTGSGKTEAAVFLAHRLMHDNNLQGLFFALPTKATADSIYKRVGKFYHKLYCASNKPSFILAHGSRNLNSEYCKSIFSNEGDTELDMEPGLESASTYCNAWLTDNHKKALLAEVGIGTIDQALISVLPQKHQSLRLLGLFNKVLVVDEVHSYDPYMNELLCKLIHFQASVGGNIILMSATIPSFLRQKFANAFCSGAGINEMPLNSSDFPLLSYLNHFQNMPLEETMDTRVEVQRAVAIRLLYQEMDVIDLIVEKIKDGKCVCWIRNTVHDVQSAFSALQEHIENINQTKYPVFHSRFCLGDRLDAETDITMRFGKSGNQSTRAGKLLVASQVIEQSLDVDFDVIISDLAPIDAIIQRAGRLQRHVRNDQGNVCSEKGTKDSRKPVLYLYGPEPVDDPPEDWYISFFPKAQYVYRNDNQLWKTARILLKKKLWKMPDDARELIEYVYSSSTFDIQPNLMTRTLEDEGTRMAEQNIAEHFGLIRDIGYLDSKNWDETNILTRLGINTTNIYLARWDGSQLLPWYNDTDWEYSQIKISGFLMPKSFEIADEQLKEAANDLKKSFKKKNPLILPLVTSVEGWKAEIIANDEIREYLYDSKFGFEKVNNNQ